MSAALFVTLVITNATWTGSDGKPVTGGVRVEQGRIVTAGPVVKTNGAQIIDAKGGWLTPGFIESGSRIGIDEVDLEAGTRDDDIGGGPIRAAFFVGDGLDPKTPVIPIQRAHGLTMAISWPHGGAISGQAAAVRFDGTLLPDPIAMNAHLGADGDRSRVGRLSELRSALIDARDWRKAKAAYQRNALRRLTITAADAAALQPVLAGRRPLAIHANRRADIRAVLRLAREFRLKVVLIGGAEAWMEAEALAKAKVPVVIDPLLALPRSFDELHARADNAALLHATGVPIVLASFSTHNARTLRQIAGNAVRAGLPHPAALDAITRGPAEAFGLGRRGQIAKGYAADLVVWTGDPFEPASQATHVIIDGKQQSLRHRQRALFERYRTLPKAANDSK